MSDNPPPNWKLRIAPWWVIAVIAGYLVFTVMSSRTVQSFLGK